MHVCRAALCEDARTYNALQSVQTAPRPRSCLFGVVEAGAGEAPEIAQRRWQLERRATLQEVPRELRQEAVVAIVCKSADAGSEPGTWHGCCRARHVCPGLITYGPVEQSRAGGWAGDARFRGRC